MMILLQKLELNTGCVWFTFCFFLLFFCRHGISRTDFNLLSDPELSFMEVISKLPSNPGTTPMNKGTVLGDEKTSSPAGSIKTGSSVPFDGFSPLNNEHENGQREECVKGLSEQLPGEDKTSEMDASVSPHEQVSLTQSTTTMAPMVTSVKTEAQTPLANTFGSGSPGSASVSSSQDQITREEPTVGVEPKTEDMDDTSTHSTPVPSQLNPGICQDEDSQLSFNQESQSSEASSMFSVRWPKVCFALMIAALFNEMETLKVNAELTVTSQTVDRVVLLWLVIPITKQEEPACVTLNKQ